MKKSIALKAYLIISGILLFIIGGSTLLMPVKMKLTEGIEIAGNVNSLNDARGFAALLLAIAFISLFGAFLNKWQYIASRMIPILFIAIGIGRLLSIILDGTPIEGLIVATGVEFLFGIAGMILFAKFRA